MRKFNIRARYTNQTKNTELDVEVNFESSDKRSDQSPKDLVRLVLDYVPLAVNLLGLVPIVLDTLSSMT